MLLASRLRDKFPFYYGWIVVGAAGTVVFARMAPAITTLTVLIFPMSQQLGWSRTLIAGSVSAGALAALVLSPVVGWAIDRFGARPVLETDDDASRISVAFEEARANNRPVAVLVGDEYHGFNRT